MSTHSICFLGKIRKNIGALPLESCLSGVLSTHRTHFCEEVKNNEKIFICIPYFIDSNA